MAFIDYLFGRGIQELENSIEIKYMALPKTKYNAPPKKKSKGKGNHEQTPRELGSKAPQVNPIK